MDNHEKTLPSSYQQASKESLDDNYKDKSVDVSFKSKQMLSDDENNSTKEALDQVNPNTNTQQFVQMSPVVITNPPSTSINQAQETNRQAYYCNQFVHQLMLILELQTVNALIFGLVFCVVLHHHC